MASSTQEPTDQLERQLHRLIIENRNESGYIALDEQFGMANEILELMAARESSIREEAYKQGYNDRTVELAENIVRVLNDLASTITDGHKPTISS